MPDSSDAKFAVLYAGGGTGGHIFPNIAIREQLTELLAARSHSHASLFFVSDRQVDAKILAGEGLPYIASRAKPFGMHPKLLWRWWRNWRPAVAQATRALQELSQGNRKVVVCCTGGFVSAAAAKAARNLRVPVVMVNLDAVPGKANRWIAKHADRVITAAAIPSGSPAWPTIPPIVRKAALPQGPAQECRASLGLDPLKPVLLVTGASQGAASLNNFLQLFVKHHAAALAGWSVLHQTGPGDWSKLADTYRDAGIPAIVKPFVAGMGMWWGAAELCVGRCGAGIVAEAWASTTPALFLPYPYHKDQHQRVNAEPLARAGSAVIETDRIDGDANMHTLGTVLLYLLADAPRRATMRAAFASLGKPDGAARAAAVIAELATEHISPPILSRAQ